MTLFTKPYYARTRASPWKLEGTNVRQVKGRSTLHSGSKQMEPLSPELVPDENTNTVREGSIHLCCLGTFLISELKISEDNQIL